MVHFVVEHRRRRAEQSRAGYAAEHCILPAAFGRRGQLFSLPWDSLLEPWGINDASVMKITALIYVHFGPLLCDL
jgi:hypothetical protein